MKQQLIVDTSRHPQLSGEFLQVAMTPLKMERPSKPHRFTRSAKFPLAS